MKKKRKNEKGHRGLLDKMCPSVSGKPLTTCSSKTSQQHTCHPHAPWQFFHTAPSTTMPNAQNVVNWTGMPGSRSNALSPKQGLNTSTRNSEICVGHYGYILHMMQGLFCISAVLLPFVLSQPLIFSQPLKLVLNSCLHVAFWPAICLKTHVFIQHLDQQFVLKLMSSYSTLTSNLS